MRVWRCGRHALPLGERTLVMGIVNVTPDSFSDGGRYLAADAAVAHGRRLAAEGADVLDVGGESTRPGAEPVSAREEAARVLPVVEALAKATGLPVSIDTMKPEVAAAALDAGASIVNDVTALREPAMRKLVAERGAGAVLMHMQGEPRTMQADPRYGDVVHDVTTALVAAARAAEAAGVPAEAIALDPGIGFGKTPEHNLDLIRGLPALHATGYAVLLGASRKSFLGKLTGGLPPAERVEAGLAVAALGAAWGADIVRVHDVAPTVRALRVADALARRPA